MQRGLPASLVQSNDLFNLLQLYEVRTFFKALKLQPGEYTILEEKWKYAKEVLKKEFGGSTTFEWICNMLVDFEKIYPKVRFKSDLETYISESRIEDFYRQSSESVLVSTIHKAKGREFDQVFLMLQQRQVKEEKEKRLLYVGMTRAKNFLSIHYQGQYLDNLKVSKMNYKEETNRFEDTDTLVMQLTHKDVFLSFSHSRQREISRLRPGDKLRYNGQECLDTQGHPILRFSFAFQKTIERLANKDYLLQKVSVNWMVYWTDSETGKEALVVLPEVVFGRKEGNGER